MKSHSHVLGIQTSIYFRERREHNSTHKNMPGLTSLHNGIVAVFLVFGENLLIWTKHSLDNMREMGKCSEYSFVSLDPFSALLCTLMLSSI